MTKKKRKKLKITFVNLNQELPHTCGSCKHTNNDLGIFALHCDIWDEIRLPESKVRSWEGKKCKRYIRLNIKEKL